MLSREPHDRLEAGLESGMILLKKPCIFPDYAIVIGL
jgi:hypothetical protein